MSIRLLAVLFLMTAALPPSASAELTEADALERFFVEPRIQREWFAPSFLDAVPFEQLEPIRARLTRDLGGLVEIRKEPNRYVAVFRKGSLPAFVRLDDEGRFLGLRLLNPIPNLSGLDDAVTAVKGLPGTVSLLVLENGEERAAVEADRPLAVGSAFKLSILAALREEIDAGRRSWSDVVTLREEWRSLPSGFLRTWPAGSSITLETLATLMISQSDNTATDALLFTLGRERVEEETARNRPFLSTREVFQLKSQEGESARRRFLKGGEGVRRKALREIESLGLPGVEMFAGAPLHTDIEWFYTARELCEQMQAVSDLDLMGVNPGVASPGDWARIAYKGGSEPGVMNMTTWVQAQDGTESCVCLTQNHTETLDEAKLTGIVSGILESLARGEGK